MNFKHEIPNDNSRRNVRKTFVMSLVTFVTKRRRSIFRWNEKNKKKFFIKKNNINLPIIKYKYFLKKHKNLKQLNKFFYVK